jgi:hypothetical protein
LTEDPEKLAKRLIYGGAKMASDIKVSKNGDIIIDMYDPNHIPIRLIKRNK